MTNNFINNFIKQNAIKLGGVFVFTQENAKAFVRLLIDNQKKILGIDGIYVNGEGHRPSLQDSMLTEELYEKNLPTPEILKKIVHFLDQRTEMKDLFFEIIFQ